MNHLSPLPLNDLNLFTPKPLEDVDTVIPRYSFIEDRIIPDTISEPIIKVLYNESLII